MKNYIISNPNSKFGHDFVQRDDLGNEIFRKEITSRTGDGYYHLPIIVNGRKLCKISYLDGLNEFCLDELPEKAPRTSATSTTPKKSAPKFNPEDYLNEKQIEKRRKLLEEVAKIDAIAEAEYNKAQALNQLEATLKGLDADTLKALMAKMNGEG